MKRILTYKITTEYINLSLRSFLRLMGFSSQNLSDLKKMPESILVNGERVYRNYLLKSDDYVIITIIETISSSTIIPVLLPLSIVYEDEDILIINKPADMPIHPSQNNHHNTLANALAYYYKSQNIPFVFRCINRLDRDTTGLTIIAKHMFSASILGTMITNREIKREYLAITDGIPDPLEGTIDAPIARCDDSTIKREVNFSIGETAITHYKSLRSKNNISLLSLWLETGRTHQIRVHLKYLCTPLLGDFLYHPNMEHITRQALHSYRLTFAHPITKEPLHFEAPLPFDMCFLD